MPITQAKVFWIEAGAMSSASRHQVELPNHLAEFFDERSRAAQEIAFQLRSGMIIRRPFVYRGTDYGQWSEQWRIHLPTLEMGGFDYPGKILKFERITTADAIVYSLSVFNSDSPEANELMGETRRTGTVGSTGGSHGRSYGYCQ